jgi:D-sedoheptulose 7-phosphate isomerase/D-glycero-D-manno-heptose 1,7-bisphosphate phosphatase
MTRRGVLLDRDGTIIVDSGYVGAVEDVVFIEGAIEAIARLNAAGLPVAVVTNQAGVARGMYELADVELVHKHMVAELGRLGARVDAWFFCPYHPDGVVPAFARTSADRKPAPGMAIAAAGELDLDLTASWVVGDRDCDVDLARAVGARPLRIGAGRANGGGDADTVADLAAAVDVILAEHAAGSVPSAAFAAAFPSRRYSDAGSYAAEYSSELARAMATVPPGRFESAAWVLDRAYERGATVFCCGNGGSASIANHFQCDHVKGVRTGTGLLTRVHSLSTNVEILSAIANDNGYENVFDFQLQSHARPGDVLVAVSSSGRSPNIVRALEWCRENDVATVALTGFTGGPARELATVSIHVDSGNYGVIEDAHQACMHLLAQYVRQSRMSDNDVSTQVF